jgi:hypothetical protein
MLLDSRSSQLVSNFAGQWLYLRNLQSITPALEDFPGFDDNLRQAFRQETELLVDSVIRENRSALDLLRANYTFLNERLAKHYGIPNVYGSRFRRVTFDGDAPGAPKPGPLGDDGQAKAARGGLLRQGSVLMVTSLPTRTSPVIRGKFVLDNLLGVPPPPPLPNVPALKDAKTGSQQPQTVRERLAEHRVSRTGSCGRRSACDCGSCARDLVEDGSLVCRIALDRLNEIRNQVVAPLQLDVDVRPARVDLVAQPDEAVEEVDGDDEQEHDDADHDVGKDHVRSLARTLVVAAPPIRSGRAGALPPTSVVVCISAFRAGESMHP